MADRKIAAMHREYGKDHAHRCAVYGVSGSAASDWAKKWTACGMYGHPASKGDTPLFERLKHAKRKADDEPLDGQISMWEVGKA